MEWLHARDRSWGEGFFNDYVIATRAVDVQAFGFRKKLGVLKNVDDGERLPDEGIANLRISI